MGVYLLFRQLGDVVDSSVRLNLGVEMVDDGPEGEHRVLERALDTNEHFAVDFFIKAKPQERNIKKKKKKVCPGDFFHVPLLLNPSIAPFGVRRGHILISKR